MAGFLEAKDIILDFAEENFGTRGEVIKLEKFEDGWEGELEITRIDEYKKKHAKPQTVERYLIELDEEGEVISFERVETRSRGEINWERE
ncbi:gas vesicle protein [Candidatus Bipolaricaulota bacterium]|nr:gas vesicle protein [Candidatus Bipolaricaulota bacterium]MBS3814180.1 gas vesicle protein [Candidatus Bipolaricaulota bacterium]